MMTIPMPFKKTFRSDLLIAVLALCLLSACGSRRHTVKTNTTSAAAAADVMSKLKNKSLYRFITDWAGVRYRLGGMDKNGVDCSGFAYLLEKDIYGIQLPRRSRDQAQVVKNKDQRQLKEGDLLFFSFGGNEVDHVGVYLSDNFFVHASTTRGVVVDDLTLPAYQKAFVKAGPVRD